MWDIAGFTISGLTVCGGLCATLRPALFVRIVGEPYTPRNARIAGIVLLVLGIAGLVAILSYNGGEVDFFPV